MGYFPGYFSSGLQGVMDTVMAQSAAHMTANAGMTRSDPSLATQFMEIDQEIFFAAILPFFADSSQVIVCALSTNPLLRRPNPTLGTVQVGLLASLI